MRIGFDAKRAVENNTGLGNYSRLIIKLIAETHNEDEILLFAPRYIANENMKSLNFRNISWCTPSSAILKRMRCLWRSNLIVKDLYSHNTDIYHGLSNELPFGIKKSCAKSIVTVHDLIFRVMPQYYHPIDRLIYDIKARYACRNADKIIAISECTKRDIIKYYDIAPEKIEVIYQGCNDIFRHKLSTEDISEFRRTHNLPDRYLLYVGTIEDRKNLLIVLKALKRMDDKIKLVVVGKPRKYMTVIDKFINENNLDGRILFLKNFPLKELPALYQGASVFIYPSRYEGFGIPIVEAIESGVPVIAAKGSCLEEAGGEGAIYIDPDDDSDLAKQITNLLNDADLRRAMVEKGREHVKKFSDANQAIRISEVYNNLLQKLFWF